MNGTRKGSAAFVLLAGGGMGEWIWERVRPLLEYPSIAIDRRYEPAVGTIEERKATISGCAEYVARRIRETGIDRAVVVAHSGSGIIAPRIPEHTDAVRKIVFLSANIPPVGKSALDMLPLSIRLMNAAAILLRSKPIPMANVEKMIRRYFCNATEESWIEFVLSHELRSEPRGIAFEKRIAASAPMVPGVFVTLLRDKTQSVESQDRMAANYGCSEIVPIDADHMVMLSAPERLAEALNGVGKAAFDG